MVNSILAIIFSITSGPLLFFTIDYFKDGRLFLGSVYASVTLYSVTSMVKWLLFV